jgi:hypothetical protein
MGKGGYLGGSMVIQRSTGWVGKGSVTSQKSDGPKSGLARNSPKNANKKPKLKSGKSNKNKSNGLTRAEQVQRSNEKVGSIQQEITTLKRQLMALEAKLEKAMTDVGRMQNLPRKSAVGVALQDAQVGKAPIENKSS